MSAPLYAALSAAAEHFRWIWVGEERVLLRDVPERLSRIGGTQGVETWRARIVETETGFALEWGGADRLEEDWHGARVRLVSPGLLFPLGGRGDVLADGVAEAA